MGWFGKLAEKHNTKTAPIVIGAYHQPNYKAKYNSNKTAKPAPPHPAPPKKNNYNNNVNQWPNFMAAKKKEIPKWKRGQKVKETRWERCAKILDIGTPSWGSGNLFLKCELACNRQTVWIRADSRYLIALPDKVYDREYDKDFGSSTEMNNDAILDEGEEYGDDDELPF